MPFNIRLIFVQHPFNKTTKKQASVQYSFNGCLNGLYDFYKRPSKRAMNGLSSTLWMTIQRTFERPFIDCYNNIV